MDYKFVFDNPAPKHFNFQMRGPDGDKVYEVCEADEGDCAAYKNAISQSMRVTQEDGVASFVNPADARAVLLSRCIHEVAEMEGKPTSYRPVLLQTIRGVPGPNGHFGWRPEVAERLFNAIKEISPGLDSDMTAEMCDKEIAILQRKKEKLLKGETLRAEVKNSQGAGTDTSN